MGVNAGSSSTAKAAMIPRNVIALNPIAIAILYFAILTPAMAGPKKRAKLKMIEVTAIAGVKISRGSIIGTRLMRALEFSANKAPVSRLKRAMSSGVIRSYTIRAKSTAVRKQDMLRQQKLRNGKRNCHRL